MAEERTRRLAAIWFADIAGYTSLAGRDVDAALAVVEELQKLATETVQARGGRIVKFMGDAVLATSESTDGAVRAALDLQGAFTQSQLVARYSTGLRIGVHVGEIVEAADGDVYGDGVNVASRIQGVARSGAVVTSDSAARQLENRSDFALHSLGTHEFKGVRRPIEVFSVRIVSSGNSVEGSTTTGASTGSVGGAVAPTQTAAGFAAALADRYDIIREIGSGGMATVYLAEDLKHNRKVAVKVLRSDLAAAIGPDRFLGEIEIVANLTHPNILPLHDSGEADGFLYFVMPFMEGESLRQRLDREQQLAIESSVEMVKRIAGALGHAHENDVIHRDIKPDNILLFGDEPAVADFGIAKAVQVTRSGARTQTGMWLGTPKYMSPEQTMGAGNVDGRTDIYALGCVLYEMLTGDAPFTGPTPESISIQHVTGELPEPTRARASIPPHVDACIRKAMEKLPADRFATAHEFARALGDTAFRHGETVERGPGSLFWKRLGLAGWTAAVALVLLIGWVTSHREAPQVTRMVMGFLPGEEPGAPGMNTFAISPDGSRFAYTRGRPEEIWVKERDALHARPLPGTSGVLALTFSHDGTEIAFQRGGDILKVSASSGAPPTVVVSDSANASLRGVAWLEDGSMVYATKSFDLWRVTASGGNAELIVSSMIEGLGQRALGLPVVLPDSRGVLFAACTFNCRAVHLVAVDLSTGETHVLVENSATGWYASTGDLVYVLRDGSLLAASFDLDRLEVTGEPRRLGEGLAIDAAHANAVMSNRGDLIYQEVDAGELQARTLQWVGRDGVEEPVDEAWSAHFGAVSVSPDGTSIAVSVASGDRQDIWVRRLDDGQPARLTFEGLNRHPRWSADGASVLFTSDRTGKWDVWRKRIDGSGGAEMVRASGEGGSSVTEIAVAREGGWLAYNMNKPTNTDWDVYAVQLDVPDAEPVSISTTTALEGNPAISPDGKWVAYASNETGQWEVYLQSFPDPSVGGKHQVSTDGGAIPMWAPDGGEMFYVDGTRMIALDVAVSPLLTLGARRPLFEVDPYAFDNGTRSHSIDRDGSRFMMVRAGVEPDVAAEVRQRLILVRNFLEELRGRGGS
jgi:eukaryotic-like serine/threonine-protein kinase